MSPRVRGGTGQGGLLGGIHRIDVLINTMTVRATVEMKREEKKASRLARAEVLL